MAKSARYKKFLERTGDPFLAAELDKCYVHLGKGDLKKASASAKALYQKFPDNLWVLKSHAALHGDYGQMLPPREERKRKKESVALLKKGLHKMRGADPWLRMALRNEYYYHSGQYLKQYRLGQSLVVKKSQPHFSKAVGASEYAWELWEKGQYRRAQKYAAESVENWEKLYKKLDRNAFYLQALAISGDPELALKRLKKETKNMTVFAYAKRWWVKYLTRIQQISESVSD